ncbi:MAG: BamA/TamA family outer membrane protein [Candidatus Omnitrophota bacterium]
MNRTIPIFLLFFLTLVVFLSPVRAEGSASDDSVPPPKAKSKNRFIGSPLVYYSPETRIAFGAAGTYIIRFSGTDDKTRPSSIAPIVIYTQEKQFKSEIKTDIYTRRNAYHFFMDLKGENYPDKFFGIGNDTLTENEESYTSKNLEMSLGFLRNVGNGYNLGLEYAFSNWTISQKKDGGLLDSGHYLGSDSGKLSGIGFIANQDTRDNIYFPMKGNFLEVKGRVYAKALGSRYGFSVLSLDLRKYVTVLTTHVFAVQALIKTQSGDVPFTELAKMGGANVMRGYFYGKYRDKSMVVIQTEYRMPLVWRFGVVAFAGIGDVAGQLNQIDFLKLKASYGLGLRLLFDKKEKIQVRLDYGFGKKTSGFYASIFEAF